jgi:hypothetical protein
VAPDLTDAEIDDICDGYRQSAAKVRFLRSMGLTVRRKPNGRPLVNRAHYIAVRSGGAQPPFEAAEPSGINWTRR